MVQPGTDTFRRRRKYVREIGYLSKRLPTVSTGDRARLRREAVGRKGVGSPGLWRLLVGLGFKIEKTSEEKIEKWATVMQAMAILTPRPAHDGTLFEPHSGDDSRAFGRALCDGGNLAWDPKKPDARPVVSELRLAKMLAAKGKLRRELVIRAAKIIAKSGAPVNCIDIAGFVLDEDQEWPANAIAKSYYARAGWDESEKDAE
ncbi:MAG: type I-E CRISPR-associated protein Cse2/CasB [Rhodomicrobium sp.]